MHTNCSVLLLAFQPQKPESLRIGRLDSWTWRRHLQADNRVLSYIRTMEIKKKKSTLFFWSPIMKYITGKVMGFWFVESRACFTQPTDCTVSLIYLVKKWGHRGQIKSLTILIKKRIPLIPYFHH